MIGASLYPKRSRVTFFLSLHAFLAVAGGVIAFRAIQSGQTPGNAEGFMIIFGSGMFLITLMKGRKPQVVVREDFLEVRQTRAMQYVRYRYIVKVTRPDTNRLVISLREDGVKRDVTIWLRELEKADVERLADFLKTKR